MQTPFVTLNNGVKMPQVGLGVFQIWENGETTEVVKEALSLGYRHIDTAHAYHNERGVGQAIKESAVQREDVWLTSKLWPSDYGRDVTPKAIDKMLARLQTDYLDLLLLHQQVGDYLDAWEAMEAALKAGKVRAIGFSNFDGERLDDLLAHAAVTPQVAQVELHPYFQQRALKKRLAPLNVTLESWYPLGHGDQELLNEPVFSDLAAKYHKTNAQVILRWHLQSGHVIFPKTTNPAHMKENLALFDFELTDDEMAAIDQLDKNHPYHEGTLAELEETVKKIKMRD